jgi:hypothetical protein
MSAIERVRKIRSRAGLHNNQDLLATRLLSRALNFNKQTTATQWLNTLMTWQNGMLSWRLPSRSLLLWTLLRPGCVRGRPLNLFLIVIRACLHDY